MHLVTDVTLTYTQEEKGDDLLAKVLSRKLRSLDAS